MTKVARRSFFVGWCKTALQRTRKGKFKRGLLCAVHKKLKLILSVLFCIPVLLSGSQLDAKISEAEKTYLIQRVFEPDVSMTSSLHQCAYTVETTIDGKLNVSERYIPWESKQKQWQLLDVNGAVPTNTQFANYIPTTRQRIPSIVNFEFIDKKTLNFVEENLAGIRFSFEFEKEYKNDGVHSNLNNTVVIDPVFGRLTEIKSEVREPFKMFPWLKVNHYESTQTFEYETELDSVVLTRFTLKVQLKSGRTIIDRDLQINYHSFDCALPNGEDREFNEDDDSGPESRSD